MVLLLRKRHLLTVVAAVALCGALLLTARPGAAAVSGSASPRRAVILDAGHGGADGGAVSDSGVAESGLNLAITLRLAEVLTFCGYEVLLTRTGEAALCDDPAATLRQQKVSDTKKRVEIINRCADARLISIHQNSLPGHPGVSGAQVFHNGQDGAEALALCIQNDLNMAVNTREKARQHLHHEACGLPRRAGGMRISVKPGGDGAASAARLSTAHGRCHRSGFLPILYK